MNSDYFRVLSVRQSLRDAFKLINEADLLRDRVGKCGLGKR